MIDFNRIIKGFISFVVGINSLIFLSYTVWYGYIVTKGEIFVSPDVVYSTSPIDGILLCFSVLMTLISLLAYYEHELKNSKEHARISLYSSILFSSVLLLLIMIGIRISVNGWSVVGLMSIYPIFASILVIVVNSIGFTCILFCSTYRT